MKIWRPLLVGLSFWAMACGPEIIPECTSAAECDDGEECTLDLCDQGECVNNADDTIVPAQGSPLDCRQEICAGGIRIQVNDDTEQPNDNVPCTDDVCSGGFPLFTPDNGGCGAASDCRALVCDPQGQQGTPDVNGCSSIIDDGNLPDDGAGCTDDSCLNGVPVFAADDVVCLGVSGETATCVLESCDPTDASADPVTGCTVVFDAGVCDDGNFCTDDACDPGGVGADATTGCIVTPNAGQPTQIVGNCNTEVCTNGNPSQTINDADIPAGDIDNIACTVGGCSAGQITQTPTNALCDDSLSCTKDTCDPLNPIADPASGCTAEAEAGQCPAGQACDPASDPGQTTTGCIDADTCPPTLAILDEQTIDSSTLGNLDDASPSCADNTGAHPDLAFSFTLNEDSDVILTATPTNGQALSLQLVSLSGGVCGAELFCVAADASEDADMNIINLAAGDYAIIVDGNGATTQEGGFSLGFISSATALLDGDLVINEVHAEAGGALLDANAEFLEIANPSAVFAVSTAGMILVEEDGTPTNQTLTANGSSGEQLIVAPGGFLLGVPSADIALNGGLIPNFDLLHGLNNTPNETLIINKGALVIDSVNLVAVGSAGIDGVSFQLDVALTDALLNDDAAAWCLTPTNVYATSNRGTPGELNESCTAPECTVGTQAADCNDNQACTDDICNNGNCQNVNDNTNTPAADAFSCTVETCLNGAPVTNFNDAACNDAVGCTLDGCVGVGGQVGTGCAFLPDDDSCNVNEVCDVVNDCQPIAGVCGDGNTDAGETCDDGNNNNNDACPDGVGGSCQTAVCGDGFTFNQGGTEQCDDTNTTPNDGCDALCQTELPGDACAVAIPLASGVSEIQETTGAADNITPSCAVAGGSDLFFTITLAQVSSLTLDLESAGNDLSVALFEGSCATPRELACVNTAGATDLLDIRGLGAGTYTIVVDAGVANATDVFDLLATVTAGGLAAGDIVINELMINPNDGAANDAAGEFVELTNPRAFFVSTADLRFASDGTGTALTQVTTGFQLIMAPGGFLVGARVSDSVANGGIVVDFTFSEGFTNGGDVVRVKTIGNTTIDVVAYPGGGGFPAVVAGESYNLDPDRRSDTANDTGANWCNASVANGGQDYDPSVANTNRGTPRQPNLQCPGVN